MFSVAAWLLCLIIGRGRTFSLTVLVLAVMLRLPEVALTMIGAGLMASAIMDYSNRKIKISFDYPRDTSRGSYIETHRWFRCLVGNIEFKSRVSEQLESGIMNYLQYGSF